MEKITLFISALALFVSLGAFLATAWQAWIANDSEKRQLRAYIGAHQVSYQDLETGNPIGFAFAFINHGQTLAKDVNMAGVIDLLPFPLPSDFVLPNPPVRPPQDGIVFPSETTPMIGWVWERTPMSMQEKKAMLASPSTKQIYMHGVISYTDIFGKRWKTTFCYFLNHASIVRDASGEIVRDKNGKFSFDVSPCQGRNRLE